MKSFNKTTIILILAVVCTVVAGGVYVFFFATMRNETVAATDLSTTLSEITGQQYRYNSVLSSLQAESIRIDKLSAYFIKESDIVAFTKRIDMLGSLAGVTLSIESLDSGISKDKTAYLNFKITAEGKFENTERFLVYLQNFPGKFLWNTVRVFHEAGPTWKVEASLTALNFIKE